MAPMQKTQSPETGNHQGEAHGNLELREIAAVTTDPVEQIELAGHPSGLVHAALRSNPSLCEEARIILDTKPEKKDTLDGADDKINTVSAETRDALKIEL